MEGERFKRGWEKLKEIDREQGERVFQVCAASHPTSQRT
jgi:hypothetical protein